MRGGALFKACHGIGMKEWKQQYMSGFWAIYCVQHSTVASASDRQGFYSEIQINLDFHRSSPRNKTQTITSAPTP